VQRICPDSIGMPGELTTGRIDATRGHIERSLKPEIACLDMLMEISFPYLGITFP
jgi:hypothetical protein